MGAIRKGDEFKARYQAWLGTGIWNGWQSACPSVGERKNSARFWGGHRSVTYRRVNIVSLSRWNVHVYRVSFSYSDYCSCVSRPHSLWPVNFIPGLTNKTIVGEITPKSYPYLFNCLAFMSFHSRKILYRTASIQEEEPWGWHCGDSFFYRQTNRHRWSGTLKYMPSSLQVIFITVKLR